jgi:hypothetical protein
MRATRWELSRGQMIVFAGALFKHFPDVRNASDANFCPVDFIGANIRSDFLAAAVMRSFLR